MPRSLRIGTRGSDLALWQARWVADQLKQAHAGLEVTLEIIKTTGDRVVDRPLAAIGGKGLFVKEIEEAMLAGRIDLAVHSLKDMPVLCPDGLELSCYPNRAEPYDALCARMPLSSIDDLPANARVGTGSERRALQLKRMRPDLVIEGLRGNVPTRLGKRNPGAYELDAVVLAEAGLRRLGLWEEGFLRLAPPAFLPAASQGTLALESRSDDVETAELLSAIDSADARLTATAERAALGAIDGNCHTPFAAFAQRTDDNMLQIRARLFDASGQAKEVEGSCPATLADAESTGKALGEALLV